jgi:hypothetical protein
VSARPVILKEQIPRFIAMWKDGYRVAAIAARFKLRNRYVVRNLIIKLRRDGYDIPPRQISTLKRRTRVPTHRAARSTRESMQASVRSLKQATWRVLPAGGKDWIGVRRPSAATLELQINRRFGSQRTTASPAYLLAAGIRHALNRPTPGDVTIYDAEGTALYRVDGTTRQHKNLDDD